MLARITIPCPEGQARKTHRKFRVPILKWRKPKRYYWTENQDTLFWEFDGDERFIDSVFKKVTTAVIATQSVIGSTLKFLRTEDDKEKALDYLSRLPTIDKNES